MRRRSPPRAAVGLAALLAGGLYLAAPRPLLAASPDELFAQGNAAYEAGHFEDAVTAYERILAYGVEDARVHYNLGNSYFRLNRPGPAILNYERALRLDPADREARDNLDLAGGMIRDRVVAPEIPYPIQVVKSALDRTSTDRIALVFVLFYLLAGGLLGAFWVSRDSVRRRLLAYGALALGLCAIVSAAAFVYRVQVDRTDIAVVMQDRVDVRAGPAADNTVLFTVHEGTRMQVRNRLSGWYQVSLPNALSGWIPAGAVEEV